MKNKRIRFKFINKEEGILKSISKDFKEVSPPYPLKHTPNGEYLFRGNKKDHYKVYYVYNNHWYLTDDKTFDNGRKVIDAGVYEYFPKLGDKKYQELYKNIKYLSKTWKYFVLGWYHYKDIEKLKRNMKMTFFKIKKSK